MATATQSPATDAASIAAVPCLNPEMHAAIESAVRTQAIPAEVQMALGRIFRLMSRPAQDGDIQQYAMARKVILDAAEARGMDIGAGYTHDFGRDYHSIVMSGQ